MGSLVTGSCLDHNNVLITTVDRSNPDQKWRSWEGLPKMARCFNTRQVIACERLTPQVAPAILNGGGRCIQMTT